MIRIATMVPGMRVWVNIVPTPLRLARVVALVGGTDAVPGVLVEFHPDHGSGTVKLRTDQVTLYQGPTVLWPDEARRLRRRYAEEATGGRR